MTAKTMTESIAQYTGHPLECHCDACLIAGALWSDGYVAGCGATAAFFQRHIEALLEFKRDIAPVELRWILEHAPGKS